MDEGRKTMSGDLGGYLNEPDLMKELTNAVNIVGLFKVTSEKKAKKVLAILVRRGLLNDLGISELRKTGIKPE